MVVLQDILEHAQTAAATIGYFVVAMRPGVHCVSVIDTKLESGSNSVMEMEQGHHSILCCIYFFTGNFSLQSVICPTLPEYHSGN